MHTRGETKTRKERENKKKPLKMSIQKRLHLRNDKQLKRKYTIIKPPAFKLSRFFMLSTLSPLDSMIISHIQVKTVY